MRCVHCGAELPSGGKFCPHCGQRLEEPRTCARCGAALRADDRFCARCGAPVTGEAPARKVFPSAPAQGPAGKVSLSPPLPGQSKPPKLGAMSCLAAPSSPFSNKNPS